MSSTYNPQSIEEEIQKKWDQEKRYESKIDGRKKYYCIYMFP
jgi:leucyl-tRNA synthetase